MFQTRVQGLEHINELSEIFASIKQIEFRLFRNDAGEIDVERSMQTLDEAIDRKLARFSHNPLARQFAEATKQQLHQKITQHAERARKRSASPIW